MPELSQKLQKILKTLPKNPGVYKMKDLSGNIIYVGKAKNLAVRVRSYFQNNRDLSVRAQKMISRIADIELIVVDTELEALILETNLIKELRPKYNILMKDDKNYVYIKITTNEDYPRITTVRKIEKDRARYFGPKTSAGKTLETLKALKRLFPFRHCNLNIEYMSEAEAKIDPSRKETLKKRVHLSNVGIPVPCLDYHIKRCAGPCIGMVEPEEYREIITPIIHFLEGRTDEVLRLVKEQMQKAAVEKKFELAARIRDRLLAIESIMEKQKISDSSHKNSDIINFIAKTSKAFFNIFLIRDGRLISQENFIVDIPQEGEGNGEILRSFLQQYYEKAAEIGEEILIPLEMEEKSVFEQWLSSAKGRRVKITVPQKGRKNKLLSLAEKNAALYAEKNIAIWEGREENAISALKEVQKALGLKKSPKRIECYDISHFAGTNTVASMVVFLNGLAENSNYRQFKIRTLPKNKSDDYAALAEALSRRLGYLTSAPLLAGITFEKAKKKDLEKIEEILKDQKLDAEALNQKTFGLLKKGKKIIGICRLKTTPDGDKPIEEIASLWIDGKHRGKKLGTHLVKMMIKKSKTSRIYVGTKPELEQYYTNIGFRVIFKIPDAFRQKKDRICQTTCANPIYMVYDKKIAQDASFTSRPDLILIDGGKGQLNTIFKVLRKMKLDSISLASIAKREEEIFIPGERTPLPLHKDSPASKLLQQIRDESHRFANQYREKLQSRGLTSSFLDEISGIGPKIRQKLLKKYGSLSGIKAAPFQELKAVCGAKVAEKILKDLN